MSVILSSRLENNLPSVETRERQQERAQENRTQRVFYDTVNRQQALSRRPRSVTRQELGFEKSLNRRTSDSDSALFKSLPSIDGFDEELTLSEGGDEPLLPVTRKTTLEQVFGDDVAQETAQLMLDYLRGDKQFEDRSEFDEDAQAVSELPDEVGALSSLITAGPASSGFFKRIPFVKSDDAASSEASLAPAVISRGPASADFFQPNAATAPVELAA